MGTFDPQSGTTRTLDGNGQQLKTATVTYNDNTESWTTPETTYYLRATALGGQVLTELNEQGQKQRTFVYAGNQVLATQEIIPYYNTQSVTWEHRDPTNASYRTSYATGAVAESRELDPAGADTISPPVVIPVIVVNPPEQGIGSLLPYPSFSSPTHPGLSYRVDGIPVSIDYFMRQVDNAFHGPFGLVEASRPRLRDYQVETPDGPANFGLDRAGATALARRLHSTLIQNWLVSDNWALDWEVLTPPPQNTLPTDLKDQVQKTVNNCSDYMNRLLNQLDSDYTVATFGDLFDRVGMSHIEINHDKFVKVGEPTAAGLAENNPRRIYINTRVTAFATVTTFELLHHAAKRGMFDDRELDKAVVDLMGPWRQIAANVDMKGTKDHSYVRSTIAHRELNRNCFNRGRP